jgi:thioredoxin 1
MFIALRLWLFCGEDSANGRWTRVVKLTFLEIYMKYRYAFTSALLALVMSAANAVTVKPYSEKALADAQKAGEPVAVHFHAEWCGTCKKQESVINALKADKALKMTVFVADYDKDTALKQRFKVQKQSTLVVLRGDEERARVLGDTNEKNIRQALERAL